MNTPTYEKTAVSNNKIRIGTSACLLGERVRYDGKHKRDLYITEVLSKYFEFIPFCPEVAIGLGVPRPKIHLQMLNGHPHAIVYGTRDNDKDVTGALFQYGQEVARQHSQISGYLFKSKSPSCGSQQVEVYGKTGNPFSTAPGIYAQALMQSLPLLPVGDENQLKKSDLSDRFIVKVFVYHHWQSINVDEINFSMLVKFHQQHKFLLMMHSEQAVNDIDQILNKIDKDIDRIATYYIQQVMKVLDKPVSRKNRADVLQHITTGFKGYPDKATLSELTRDIDNYRTGRLPIIVPLTLIRHHLQDRCLPDR